MVGYKDLADKCSAPRAGEWWTKAEETRLEQLWAQGKSVSEIARRFKRTEGAVRSRLHLLKRVMAARRQSA